MGTLHDRMVEGIGQALEGAGQDHATWHFALECHVLQQILEPTHQFGAPNCQYPHGGCVLDDEPQQNPHPTDEELQFQQLKQLQQPPQHH